MNLFESKVSGLLGSLESDFWSKQESIRIREAEILYYFYKNKVSFIREVLKERMTKSGKGLFKEETFERFPAMNYINPIPKLLRILCSIYKEEPKRILSKGETPNEAETARYLDFVAKSALNTKMQEIHKLGKLYGTIHVMPVIRNGQIKHEILHPYRISVDTYEDDPSRIKQIGILDWRWNEDNSDFEKYIIVWSETEHYLLDSDLNKITYVTLDGKKKDLVNNYKRIPVEVLRFDEDDSEHFGDPLLSLVENSIDLSVTNICMSYNLPLLIGGVPVLTDYEIENLMNNVNNDAGFTINGKVIGNKEQDDSLKIGTDTVINLQNNGGDSKADFKYVTPQTNIEVIRAFQEWKQKNLLSSFGVSSNSFTMEKAAQSGYAKQMDELETIDARKQDIPKLRDFENRYFELVNLIAKAEEIKEANFESSALNIDYPELTYPKSQEEITKERDTAIKYNTKSPVDFIMEDNPDLTREEAEEIYKKNKELNSGSRISINVGGEQNTNNQTSAGMGGMADATNQLDNIEPIKEIEFPDLRQDYDFTCGASSLQGVLQLYGDDAVESELVKELNTEKDWGTEHTDIIKVAIAHGFKAESKSMTIEEVQSYIDEDYPVILDIQAWTEQKNVDYSTDKEDGHYVVAIGYDENGFVVEDPSSIGRAYLSFADLESRWHDVDKQGNELKNLGIVIKGEIKYSRNKYVELG